MDPEFEPQIVITKRLLEQIEGILEKPNTDTTLKTELKKYVAEENIPFRLVKQVHDVVSKSGEEKVYLHELLEGTSLHLPELKLAPRNPELEARCKKLKAEQENKRYKAMVKNVDKSNVDYYAPGKDGNMYGQQKSLGAGWIVIGKLKELNRQLVSVFNFVITVGGAFAFGYKATEFTFSGFGNVFALQLMAALTLATIVFFADLYFLLKEDS